MSIKFNIFEKIQIWSLITMKKTRKTSNGLGFRLDLEIKLVGLDFWKVFT